MPARAKHYCPIDVTLGVIGGKWKLRILYQLSDSVLRFGELQKRIPGITQKMLTQQLRELERDGMIARKVYAEVPPRVEYSVTEYGMTIRPAMEMLALWGTEHMKRPGPRLSNKKAECRSAPAVPARAAGAAVRRM